MSHKNSNLLYLTNMATQEYIRKLEGLVSRVIIRNPELSRNQITKRISEHFEVEPSAAQVMYVIKNLGYRRNNQTKQYEKVTKARTVATRKCMRCGENKTLKGHFKKYYNVEYGDIGFDNYLVICVSCVQEESHITGENISELNGVYALLQQRYQNVLDESMYDRYWELALGLR